MLDDKFNQDLLGKIQQKKIIPKWHFLLKDYVVWFFGVLSLIVGGLSFSVILYLTKYNDWDAYSKAGETFLSFVFLTLPYFWIVFLIMFMAIVFYNIKHTKKGYKYSLPVIFLINIVLSIFLGVLFFNVGIGQKIDDVLGAKAPFYSEIINRRMSFWCSPENGRLVGLVSEINDDNFKMMNFEEEEWIVKYSDGDKFILEIGTPVRVIGNIIANKTFKAEEVLPPGRPGRGMFERHRMGSFEECENECENHVRGMMQGFRSK